MKIISKFKDFYDYKVAKYGMDEKLVYTRKTYCEYYKKFVIDVYTGLDNRISEENFNKNLKENFEYFKGNNYHKILVLGEKLIHLMMEKILKFIQILDMHGINYFLMIEKSSFLL